MTVHVALFGSHGTGKTYIADKLQEHLEDVFPGIRVARVHSTTRYAKSLGFPNNEGRTPETQLVSGVMQVVREREALKDRPHVLLSDRTVLDRLCYNLQQKITLDENTEDYRRLSRVHAALVDLWEAERSRWDYLYYKPVHPDYVPDEDGDRSGSRHFQSAVDMAAKGMAILYLDYSQEYDPILPMDRDEAYDAIVSDIFDRVNEEWCK